MKIKIGGIILFYMGFLLIAALLLVRLYNSIGLTGVFFGAMWMLIGILFNYLGFYIDIDTTDSSDSDNDNEEDEKDIR